MSWWTSPRDAQLRTLWAAGSSSRTIGEALGCSYNSVTARARRLRLARRATPIPGARQAMDDIAEQMASGCPSISEAARRLHLSQSRADQHWQAIKAGLGVGQCA